MIVPVNEYCVLCVERGEMEVKMVCWSFTDVSKRGRNRMLMALKMQEPSWRIAMKDPSSFEILVRLTWANAWLCGYAAQKMIFVILTTSIENRSSADENGDGKSISRRNMDLFGPWWRYVLFHTVPPRVTLPCFKQFWAARWNVQYHEQTWRPMWRLCRFVRQRKRQQPSHVSALTLI